MVELNESGFVWVPKLLNDLMRFAHRLRDNFARGLLRSVRRYCGPTILDKTIDA
jgi:hypothetical protein